MSISKSVLAQALKKLQTKTLGFVSGCAYRGKNDNKNPYPAMNIAFNPRSKKIIVFRKPKVTSLKYVDNLGRVIPKNLRGRIQQWKKTH